MAALSVLPYPTQKILFLCVSAFNNHTKIYLGEFLREIVRGAIEHDAPLLQRGLHGDEPLVAGASEQETFIALRLDEGSVDQNVDKL